MIVSICLFADGESLWIRVSISRASSWVFTSVPPEARRANPRIVERVFPEQGEHFSARHDESTSCYFPGGGRHQVESDHTALPGERTGGNAAESRSGEDGMRTAPTRGMLFREQRAESREQKNTAKNSE